MAIQERFQLVLPSWLKIEIKKIAESKQISMSEAIKDILKQHIKDFEQSI